MLSTRPASRATLGPWIRSDRAAEYLDHRVATRPPFPALEVVRHLQLIPGSSRPRRRAWSTQQAFPVRHEPSRQAAAKKQVGLRNFRPKTVPAGLGVRYLQVFPGSPCPRRRAWSTQQASPVRREPSRQAAAKKQVGLRNFRPKTVPAGLGLRRSHARLEETASVRRERACLRIPSRLKNPNPAKTLAPESPTGAPKGVALQELGANWEFRHSRKSSGWTHRKQPPRWTPPAAADLP